MALVKTLLAWVSVGALLGLLVASLLAPAYLQWDNTPASGQALCDCGKTTRESATRLLTIQSQGAAAGGIITLVAGIVWEVRKRKKAAPPAAAAG